MKTKYPVFAAMFLNLIVWNVVVFRGWGVFSTGYYVGIHLTISSLSILFLWLLSHNFLRSNKSFHLLLQSVLTAFLPLTISFWLTIAGPQLLAMHFEGLLTEMNAAVIVTVFSFKIWIPLGIANFFLLDTYSKIVRSSNNETNEMNHTD